MCMCVSVAGTQHGSTFVKKKKTILILSFLSESKIASFYFFLAYFEGFYPLTPMSGYAGFI